MRKIKRLYFWLTGLTSLIALLAVFFAGYAVILTLIIFPVGLLAIFVANVTPTIALGFLCGLPAVATLPRWRVAAPLFLIGAGVFASQTILVPYQAGRTTKAFLAQTETPDIAWPETRGTAQINLGDKKTSFGCGQLCQTLLIDAAFETVRIHATPEDVGVSYRLAEGSACKGTYQNPTTCILVTQNESSKPDLVVSKSRAKTQLGARRANLLGLGNRPLTMAQVPPGLPVFAQTGLRPIAGALPKPLSLSGGLESMDLVGFSYDRTTVPGAQEKDLAFLQRLGLQVGQTPYDKRTASLKNTWTMAARAAALSAPLPPKVKKRLEGYQIRLLQPEEVLNAGAEDSLALLESLLDGTRHSGTEMSTVKLKGHSHLLWQHPDHRTQILRSFIAHLTTTGKAKSDRLRKILRVYREQPEDWRTDDLPGAQSEYAAYLAMMHADPDVRDHWLTSHFRIWGALFDLPPVPPSELSRISMFEDALNVQCLTASRDLEAARAYAVAAVNALADRRAEYDATVRGAWIMRRSLTLAQRTGNLDTILALWQDRMGLSGAAAADWKDKLAKQDPQTCIIR